MRGAAAESVMGVSLLFTRSPQADVIDVVPGRGVGEQDLVPGLQPVPHLDGRYGRAAELHLDARGRAAVLVQAEDRDRRLRLRLRRASHVADVGQPLQLDRAV